MVASGSKQPDEIRVTLSLELGEGSRTMKIYSTPTYNISAWSL